MPMSIPKPSPPGTRCETFDGIRSSEDLDRYTLARGIPRGRRSIYRSSFPNCAMMSEAQFRELDNDIQTTDGNETGGYD